MSKLSVEFLYRSGLHKMATPLYSGRGCILTFHRVVSGKDEPNRISWSRNLEVSVNYMHQVLESFQKTKYHFISLDELPEFLKSKTKQRFVIATFDDGYKDNMELALPVFKAMSIPMCIYVCTGLSAKECNTWWYGIEEVLLDNNAIDLPGFHCECKTIKEKEVAYLKIREQIIHQPFDQGYGFLEKLVAQYPVMEKKVSFEALNHEEIKQLSIEKLVTIGAHSHHHYPMSKLSEDEMMGELEVSKKILEQITGKEINHFAFPYGSKDECGTREFKAAKAVGFSTATTTRQGHVFSEHLQHLTALPRIPVIENEKKLFALSRSGFLPAYLNKFKRLVSE